MFRFPVMKDAATLPRCVVVYNFLGQPMWCLLRTGREDIAKSRPLGARDGSAALRDITTAEACRLSTMGKWRRL
jgi:hypothetical protein